MTSKPKDLQERFLRKLKSSGLTLKDSKKLQFSLLSRQDSEKLKVKPYEGFKIPYFDLEGKTTEFYRVRYLESTLSGFHKSTGIKEQRYAQPPETLNEAYLPPSLDVGTSSSYFISFFY